jgi:hypothetical protein
MPPVFLLATLTAALGVIIAQAASADARWFVTAAGVEIETPAIAELDCPRMRAVLDAIDASGYRRDAPEPLDEADMALFDYEHTLSAAFYADCVQPSARIAEPQAAFSAGYEAAGQ